MQHMKRVRLRRMIVSALLVYGSVLIFYYSFVSTNHANVFFQYNRDWIYRNVLPEPTARNARILCAIMTMEANHKSKAAAVRDTWSKRCDGTIFFTTSEDSSLNSSLVVLNITLGRDFLWQKTRAAFLYMDENHGDKFDWFLKSDDDTYFIIDNLRSFLSEYDPDDRVWFGCEFVHHTSRLHFPSGGAGYVLSRGAIKAFAQTVSNETRDSLGEPRRPNASSPSVHGCGLDGGSMGEDVRFSVCLESAGVKLVDAQGPNGTYRFLPTMLEHFVYPEKNGGNGWMTMYRRKLGQGIGECCDRKLISIHYAHPKLMYVYEFLIYHLKLGNVL